MTIHKEGKGTLGLSFIVLVAVNALVQWLTTLQWLEAAVLITSIVLYAIVLQFFRNPTRTILVNPEAFLCPADGKIVTIEEVYEEEFLKEKCIQLSIFMSPLNVHANYYPIKGRLPFVKYHPGKFLVAWHPKSSTENERTTIVLKNESSVEVLYRQIAGALARRIVNYAKTTSTVQQGEDAGFIKFGSRVDLFLPLNTKINVKINQKVKGAEDIIAVL